MINTNLKFCRRELALTQAQMADKLGIKRSLVGAYEEGRAEPRLATLVNMARLFGITLDQLVTTDFSKKKNAKIIGTAPAPEATADTDDQPEPPTPAGGKLRVLAFTVDQDQNENIELVPQKAAAGYLNGYADREYLEVLPKFRLPMLSSTGTYRAFEIAGDSMLPIASGTVIVGRYVEDWTSIKDGTPCIVVSTREGIVFKRVYNKLRSGAMFVLHSDNPHFSPYDVKVDDVLEIWEAKSYISSTFPIAELSLERVASLVLDLQQQVALLKKA
ncbi:helix-turn-helix domain-containing protein [Hymenobacter monticola]|uniref:Helix-turn-helix domain-containing protein n=1 Tax=Hymenobacter monticola TaxID=1705399 RepID=A0ABY4B395_9BACT|nr:helix-turn-helix domain-containing protein [Hymenobacter monticola]UOE32248.1 helix-turn-helix domain-containing protein [Hymenobacter monticola]